VKKKDLKKEIEEMLKTEEGKKKVVKMMIEYISKEIEEKELLKYPIFENSKIKGTFL